MPQVTGVGNWHINADEVRPLRLQRRGLRRPGEASFEEKPDGSALVPPRVVFQPGTPYRASDHDPVIVGLFSTAIPNLSLSKTADATTVSAGSQIGFIVTASNSAAAGTGTATGVVIDDPLPSGTGVDWSIASGPANCSITGARAEPDPPLHRGRSRPGCERIGPRRQRDDRSRAVPPTPIRRSLTATNSPTLTANASTTVRCPNLSLSKTADATTVQRRLADRLHRHGVQQRGRRHRDRDGCRHRRPVAGGDRRRLVDRVGPGELLDHGRCSVPDPPLHRRSISPRVRANRSTSSARRRSRAARPTPIPHPSPRRTRRRRRPTRRRRSAARTCHCRRPPTRPP